MCVALEETVNIQTMYPLIKRQDAIAAMEHERMTDIYLIVSVYGLTVYSSKLFMALLSHTEVKIVMFKNGPDHTV